MTPPHRVWVVGVGMLGEELVRRCRAKGAQVLGIDAQRDRADVCGLAQESTTLQEAVQKLDPEIVYCCVSTRGGDEAAYWETYVRTATQVVSTVPSARVVYCSTCSVYGEQRGAEVTEASVCHAAGEKMRAVLTAERSVCEAGGVVARLAALYGPRRCEILRRYVQMGEKLPGEMRRKLNYVHVKDAADALMLLAERGESGQLYNVSSETFFADDFYAWMAREIGLCPLEKLSSCSHRGRVNQCVNSNRLRALGWEPQHNLRSFAQTMSSSWERSEGYAH